MPRCPNCGRETQRTEDWACQWCGHPLLSNAFKKIPKTYRELQEERSLNVSLIPEEEPEPAPTAEAEVEPEPPAPEPAPEPTPKPLETEAEPEPAPAKEPVAEAEPEAPPQPEPDAAAEAGEEVEKELQPSPEPEPETIESSELVKEPEPAPAAEAVPAAAVPPQTPIAAPALETDPATGTINVTVEELDAAFNSDKAGTNAKLVDKLLRVTGPVQKIFAKDNLDIFYIILANAGNESNWQVRCTFSREHGANLSRLTEGQEQTVQGTYVGYERNIILKECSLVQ